MKMIVIPRYKDLFDGPIPNLDDLLQGIPSELILELLSLIQAKVYLGRSDIDQMEVLNLFLSRQPAQIQTKIIRGIFVAENPEKHRWAPLFEMNYILDFMHYILVNFREGPSDFLDTNADQELYLLQAYVIFIENRNNYDNKLFEREETTAEDFFYKKTWPMLSGQFGANIRSNPFTSMIRGVCLLNFLLYDSEYKELTASFLLERGHPGPWSYIVSLSNIIMQSWGNEEPATRKTTKFSISADSEFKQMFDSFALDPALYRNQYKETHQNYAGIKARPLYRTINGDYIILNWNFLSNKLHDSLIFDLHKHFGPKVESFKKLPDFKNYISSKVTEPVLFRRLISTVLKNRKYDVLIFDESQKQGAPDAYFRRCNDIFLFELKDAFFSAAAVHQTYEAIKIEIDKKYNRPNKGIGQLIAHLNRMRVSSFEEPKRYKHNRNLVIYPIMIYTDHFFGMPGVINYLQKAFSEKITEEDLKKEFKIIKPLIFIDLQFLINIIDLCNNSNIQIKELFELFYNEQKRANKKEQRTQTVEDYFSCYDSFETVITNRFSQELYKSKGFVQKLFNSLDLTHGLPQSD